ncbi:MAG: dockerin type I domain-containing protein, partial [Sodaliphilus sp.]|nr:dockerin type I domain-containing protein [Sodaliphilus sp.]
NWLALHLPQALDDAQKAQYKGKFVKSFRGVLENKVNMSFKLIDMPQIAETDTTVALNSFIPANLQGSQMVDSVSYFLMRPKPMEIDTIRSVMWNGFNKTIEMPYNPEKYGMLAFKGVAKVDTSLYETDSVRLNDNYVYDMIALTTVAADSSLLVYPLQAWNERVTQFPLSQVVNDAHFKEGMNCELEDSSLVVMYVAVGAKQLYAKDYGQYATPDIPTEQQTDVLKGDYDQSNWVVLNLPEPLDSAQCAAYIGRQLTGVKGVIRSIANPTIDCEINPVAGEKDTTAVLNSFIPANFLGSQKVDSVNYFLARPKPMEIDTVRCAMWNKAADRFEMPFVAADFGVPQFEGAMKPVFMLTEGDKSDLKDGYVYDLLVQTRMNDNETFGYVSKVLGEQKPSYSLASMLSVDRMEENATYSVKADDLTVMHISPDSLTIYAKDAAKGVNATVPADGQTDYLGSDKYAQHNWVAITLPQPLDSAQMADFPGRHIQGFDAELTSKAGAELRAVAVPAVGEKDTIAYVNSYIAANFHGSQAVGDKNYFFAKPAAMEIDTVRCVQWDAFFSTFSAPLKASEWGMPQFDGKFKVDMSRLEVDTVELQDDFVYDIVTLNTVAADGSNKVYLLEVVRELGGKKPLVGDMNNDGLVDVTDTSILINGVLDKSSANLRVDRADINGDGVIDVTDVSLLIGIALGM